MDPRRQQHPSHQQAHYYVDHNPHAQPQENQRFSWQIPLSEQERQPIHQIEPSQSSRQEPDQRYALQQMSSVPHPAPTAALGDNRYSIMQTPIEMQQPTFPQHVHAARRPTEPSIPQSPTDAGTPVTEFGDISAITPTAHHPLHDPLSFPLEKEVGGGQHDVLPEEYNRTPPAEPHPAFFAPIDPTERATMARASMSQPRTPVPSTHQHHYPSAPSSPGPIPMKTEHDNDTKVAPTSPTSNPNPNNTFAPYYEPPPTQPRPIFSPDAPAGPNGMLSNSHQPGQIAHPNMNLTASGSKHEWKHSLCECSGDVGTCMTGVFCPCVLYGKTSYRLGLKSAKKDPTDLLGWSWANGQCGIMAVASLCGLCGIFPMIHRTRLRHSYSLHGSLPGDIARACCCCCCAVIQNEREVRDREGSARRWAGPASGAAYERQAPMVYEPPPRG